MENDVFYGKTCCKIISPKPMEWTTMKNFTSVAKFVSIHYILAILTSEDMESIK
jgi:hypothetical protein